MELQIRASSVLKLVGPDVFGECFSNTAVPWVFSVCLLRNSIFI